MGNSAHENKSWAASVIYKLKPKTVLDIGPGEGIYGKIVRKYSKMLLPYGIKFQNKQNTHLFLYQ